MSDIFQPFDWDIFNISPVEPVQYYLILKKKREFTELIEDHDSEISKQSYVHYCSIVPTYSYMDTKKEIYILLFDGVSNASSIGLRLKVNSKSFVYEENFLLIFLKKLKNKLFYHIKENYILIQCETTDVWELFYILYDMYLRRYMITVIGTNFFYSYMYSYFIQKDIQLLQILYEGSKFIKISKESVFYELFHECKISLGNLIHTLINMPKDRIFTVPNFDFKMLPILTSKLIDWKLHLPIHKKIINELQLKSIKMQLPKMNILKPTPTFSSPVSSFCESTIEETNKFHQHSKQSYRHSFPLKRKYQEIVDLKSDAHLPSQTSTNLEDILYADQWETYSNIKYFSINSYSKIPCIQHLIPNLLKNQSKNRTFSNFYIEEKENIRELYLESRCTDEVKDYCKNIVRASRNVIYKAFSFAGPSSFNTNTNVEKCSILHASKAEATETEVLKLEPPIDYIETNDFLFSQTFNTSLNSAENVIFDDLSDIDFKTATGNIINISHSAIVTAHKMMNDVFCNDNLQTNQPISSTSPQSKAIKNKSVFKSPVLFNKSTSAILDVPSKLPSSVNMYPDKIAKNISANAFTNSEQFNVMENSDFISAAGKIMCVSSSSIQAANKILKEVLDEETHIAEKNNMHHSQICTEQHSSKVPDSSSKFISEEISRMDVDGKLVEHFFTESPFEMSDTNLEVAMECNTPIKTVSMEKKVDIQPTIHKPRKSLGARRSKIYSNML